MSMAKKYELDLFQINEKTWVTSRNYKTKSYTIAEHNGRFYLWADDVMTGRHLIGVLPSMAQAKTEIEIHIQKGGSK